MNPTPPSPEHRAQDHGGPEPNFPVWLTEIGRVAIEVKGGRYRGDGGIGQLRIIPLAEPLEQSGLLPDAGYFLRSAEDPEQGSPQNAPESP